MARDFQKSYDDFKRKHKEFSVEDHVYLQVNPKKSSLELESYTKVAPWFSGPFQFMEMMGPMEYKLSLPTHLRIHIVFHISLLKKYVYDSTHIIDWNVVQVEPEGGF